MSASLPRIKTVHEISQNPLNEQPFKLKFRKLALDPNQNGEERKKSVRTLKTQRLKSLQRYTTVQEQREFKNQKIHLNLIERKLLSGTYDQKKETGNQLNALKQKRDNIKVEAAFKQREIDRLKVSLEQVKKQINEFTSKRGEHDGKLKSIKDKHEAQTEKTEAARQTKAVLQSMTKIRHDVNLVLCKRHNQLKQNLSHLQSAMTLIQTQLREATEKCAIQEGKLEDLLEKSAKERSERNQQIAKHQEKISRRKEGEVLQTEKSREYIAHLDEVERQSQFRNFQSVYSKILANLFISRYCKVTLLDLTNKYEKYDNSYRLLCSYRSFDPENPSTLVERFMEHEPEKISKQKYIQQTEKKVVSLQAKNKLLKEELANLEADFMDTSCTNNVDTSENQMSKQQLQIIRVKNEDRELNQKSMRIKGHILRLLRDLNQRGERKLDTGYQPALNNLTLLVQIIKQMAEV